MISILHFYTDLHTVAVIKAPKNYQSLSAGFRDIFTEINNLIDSPVISIQDVDYEVIFYLCSDYKVKS